MKVVVKGIDKKEMGFPLLMENDGVILFATGKGVDGYDGVIVRPYEEDYWGQIHRMNYWNFDFKPFNGSITLSND